VTLSFQRVAGRGKRLGLSMRTASPGESAAPDDDWHRRADGLPGARARRPFV